MNALGGGLFLSADGFTKPVALVGEVRPDRLGFWSGFLQIKLNENNQFVFTDFQGLIQDGVFLGSLLPSPLEIVDRIRTVLVRTDPDGGTSKALGGQIRPIATALRRGAIKRAIKHSERTRVWIQHQEKRTPEVVLDTVDSLLDDLLFLLHDAEGP